jgi:hypothetical protein
MHMTRNISGPDELPGDLLRVNGYRHVKSHEFFVEWRDVGRDRAAHVWIEYESTPNYSSGWHVAYELKEQRSGRILDSQTVGDAPPGDFDSALKQAVSFMRRHGTGTEDLEGGLPSDFDFGGGL